MCTLLSSALSGVLSTPPVPYSYLSPVPTSYTAYASIATSLAQDVVATSSSGSSTGSAATLPPYLSFSPSTSALNGGGGALSSGAWGSIATADFQLGMTTASGVGSFQGVVAFSSPSFPPNFVLSSTSTTATVPALLGLVMMDSRGYSGLAWALVNPLLPLSSIADPNTGAAAITAYANSRFSSTSTSPSSSNSTTTTASATTA